MLSLSTISYFFELFILMQFPAVRVRAELKFCWKYNKFHWISKAAALGCIKNENLAHLASGKISLFSHGKIYGMFLQLKFSLSVTRIASHSANAWECG